uniref:Threonyl/alanyl tRNA synthetase SAD domain-containing protein n=1 Tax=Megaselia scalaris TaxID=36166 RepID=T1GEV4_MEGSC
MELPSGNTFIVTSVELINGCIVHKGHLSSSNDKINLGDSVILKVDPKARTRNIIHHSATHILNAAVKSLFNKVTYQISTPMKTSVVNASDVLQSNDVTLVPGEIYPETGLRLLSMESEKLRLISRELCCGTHVRNSEEILDFCIINHKQTNRARYLFTAVAGEIAVEARKRSKTFRQRINRLEKQLKEESDTHYVIDEELQKVRNQILHTDIVLPYLEKLEILDKVNGILKKIKEASRTTLKEFVEHEMRSILQEKTQEDHPFIVHYLRSSALMEEVPLQKATKVCPDRPILVISMTDGYVKARCTVPKDQVNSNFTAQKWMQEFASTFKGQVTIPKG